MSVIIPSYNRSALLTEAICSVIKQTYRPIECIVVDDGSTDNTGEVVGGLQNKCDSSFVLKYISQANAGVQAARNTGTAAAGGEFIQYLDSDDLLYPPKIERQVEYFNRHPACDAVFGDWEAGDIIASEKIVAHKNDDLILQFLAEKCIANFAVLMRSALIKKIGAWDAAIKRNQEVDFHLRAILAGGHFEYQPLNCGLWRIHKGERIAYNTGAGDILDFYRKWELLLAEKGLLTENVKQAISNTCFWLAVKYMKENALGSRRLMEYAVSLNPAASFINTPKMRLLSQCLGKKNAIKIWLSFVRNKAPFENGTGFSIIQR